MKRVIITNLSILREGAPDLPYESECGTVVGAQTNDAPVKALLLEAAQSAPHSPVTVIAVTTAEAQTAFTRLGELLQAFAEKLSLPPPVLLRADITGHSLADAVQRIVRQIPPHAEVCIDTTGSFRNASYILLAVVRILEYSGIHCVKAVYSNYHAEPRHIEDVTNAYRLFDLINAANSFTAFGNSTELERFFREKDTPGIQRVVAAMKEFSEAVAMCRTAGLDRILAEMNESLAAMDAMTPTTEEEALFCSISGLIRQKFGIPSACGKIEYPEIIRWCLSNQMIQQAVTIYIEKIPAFLMEKQYFTVSEAICTRAEEKRGVYDFAYHVLYKEFMQMQSPIAFFLQHLTAAQRRAVAAAASPAELPEEFLSALHPTIRLSLNRIIRLKNRLFGEDGKRRADANDALPPELSRLKGKLAANAPDFLNQLQNLQPQEYHYLEAEARPDAPVYRSLQLNTIENLEAILGTQTDCQVLRRIPDMQRILRDYYYVKEYLRNVINHAGSAPSDSEENAAYFRAHGYCTDENMRLAAASSVLTEALEHLI